MHTALSAHKSKSIGAVAIDFEPVLSSSLLDAFEEAQKFCEWTSFQSTGMLVNLRRASPRMALHASPNKVVTFCLPTDEFLTPDFNRNLGNLYFRMTERVSRERIKRMGVAVSAFIPLPEINFASFALSFSEHSLRQSLIKTFNMTKIDSSLTVTGEGEGGVSFRTVMAPMSKEQLFETIKGSPIVNAVRDASLDEDALSKLVAWIGNSNFWFDTDHYVEDFARSELRSTMDRLLLSIDRQFKNLIDFYALEK